jgi:MFS family permease
MMEKRLESNIWKYGLLLIANKRIFVAILGAYYLTIPEVTPQTIGFLLLAGSLSGFIFEVPSGYVSDKMGHKHALVASRILMILSTFSFLIADKVAFLMLGAIFLNASGAFMSGTGSAFMHETLRALKKEDQYSKIMGKLSSVGFAVPIAFMVLTPFLVSISYKIPFALALVVDVIGLLAALSLTVPTVSQEQIDEIGATNFVQVVKEGYRLNFFSLALFSGVISGTLLSVGVFRAPYQSFLQIPVIWFGVLFGIGRVFASLMLAYSGKVKGLVNMISFYRFQFVLYTLLFVLLGTLSNVWVIAVLFIVINAFQWGLTKIDEGYQLSVIRSSNFKATLLSAGSQIDQIASAISSVGVGFMIERFSYQYGFLYTGIIFFLVLLPIYLYIAHRHKLGAYGDI